MSDDAPSGAVSPVEPAVAPSAPIAPRPIALTLTEASKACRVHRSTIRRRLDADEFPNAWRDDEDGVWRIPVTDLAAAGLHLSHHGSATPERDTPEQPEQVDELARLRTAYSDALRRAEVAEAVAHERARTIDLLEQALRALPSGVVTVSHALDRDQEHERAHTAPEPRRRWWRRSPTD